MAHGFTAIAYAGEVSQLRGGRRSLHDVGVGFRIALAGSALVRFDCGHGLSDGANACFFGLNQVF